MILTKENHHEIFDLLTKYYADNPTEPFYGLEDWGSTICIHIPFSDYGSAILVSEGCNVNVIDNKLLIKYGL